MCLVNLKGNFNLSRAFLAWLGQRLTSFEGHSNLSKAIVSLVLTDRQPFHLSRAFASLVETTFGKLGRKPF
jgi:hypothetical protein